MRKTYYWRSNNRREKWSSVHGFSNYQVSTRGRVKTVGKVYVKKNGTKGVLLEKIKKQCLVRGHKATRLTNDKGKSRCVYVHRLMAIAFIPNPKRKPCVNHKDGVKVNNKLKNLEWCTWAENNQHAIDNGLRGYKRGSSHRLAVFSEFDVLNIKDLYKSGVKVKEIVSIYKRSRGAIEGVIKGRSYK